MLKSIVSFTQLKPLPKIPVSTALGANEDIRAKKGELAKSPDKYHKRRNYFRLSHTDDLQFGIKKIRKQTAQSRMYDI